MVPPFAVTQRYVQAAARLTATGIDSQVDRALLVEVLSIFTAQAFLGAVCQERFRRYRA